MCLLWAIREFVIRSKRNEADVDRTLPNDSMGFHQRTRQSFCYLEYSAIGREKTQDNWTLILWKTSRALREMTVNVIGWCYLSLAAKFMWERECVCVTDSDQMNKFTCLRERERVREKKEKSWGNDAQVREVIRLNQDLLWTNQKEWKIYLPFNNTDCS